MNRAPSTPAPDLDSPAPQPVVSAREPAEEPALSSPPVPAYVRPPATLHTPLTLLGLLDVVVLVVAAPLLLLAGVPAGGYLVSAGAWIALRAVGLLVDRIALAVSSSAVEISLRLIYLLGRLFALAAMVVLLRNNDGRHSALTALLVILVAFSIELVISAVNRPRAR